jgi:O-antigen ligase
LLASLGICLLCLVGMGLGLVLGVSISDEAWLISAAVLLAVPVGAILLRYPFVGVVLWVGLRPYLDAVPEAAADDLFWLIHRGLLPAAVGAVLLSRWLRLRRWRSVRLGMPELAMVAFLAIVAVNVYFWGWDPGRTTRQAYDRLVIPFCGYLLVRLADPSRGELKLLVAVAFITLVVQSGVAFLSLYAPQLLPPSWAAHAVLIQRTVGTLRQPASYTATLIWCGLLLFHYALSTGSRITQLVLVAVTGLVPLFVFLSFSRASWLGGVVVLAGLLVVYPGPTLRMVLVAVVVVAISVFGFGFMADELAWGSERLSGEQAEDTAQGRVVINRALAEMTADKPLQGWGYESHQYYAPRYLRPVGDMKIPRIGQIPSHNSYLTISSELGVPALLLYLFPTVWWLAQSLRVWRRLPRQGFLSWRMVALMWLVILNVAVASGFSDMARWATFGTTIWWLSLGFIASLVAPCLADSESAGLGRQPTTP